VINCAQEMAARGELTATDDLLHVTVNDLASASRSDLKSIASRNRAQLDVDVLRKQGAPV
jgi:hypothetical protein